MPDPLAYDELPAGSDLAREFTPDGGVTITSALREPSARALRWARRRAVPRAALSATLALGGAVIVAKLLLDQVVRAYSSYATLPPIVFPLLGVFGAAVFLLAWHVTANRCIDALHEARRQVTIISADPTTLRVQSDGPFGLQSHTVAAMRVRQVTVVHDTKVIWCSMHRRFLRVKLDDGNTIAFLPGRDESELAWVAATLRRVLLVPQQVAPLR